MADSGLFLQTLVDGIRTVNAGSKFFTTNSLVSATKVARVEPLCIVSQDCLTLDYTPDIMHTLLNIYASYYLQAVALTTQIGSIKVASVLDMLNPDRDLTTFASSLESHSEVGRNNLVYLAKSKNKYRLTNRLNKPALEDETRRAALELNAEDPLEGIDGQISESTTSKPSDAFKEMANITVGKVLDVTFKMDEKEVVIPVTVKLNSIPLPNHSVVTLLASKADDTGFIERMHGVLSGRLKFWRDGVFALDLLREHKKALMGDKTGIMTQIMERARRNTKYGFLSVKPSLATASNIFVISEASAIELERKFGGKLTNPKVRSKAFEATYGMILVVIDRNFERVTFYLRDIDSYTNVSVRDIKYSNKSKGPDVGELLKMLSEGKAPIF